MALIECKEPVFDRKVNKVLELLEEGKDKETIAEELGYTNPISLDNYMRRRNFAWESRQKKYVPASEKYSAQGRNNILKLKGISKAALVISLFTEDGADPRDIAEQTGFVSHNDMAVYMKRKGYEWDTKKANYVKANTEDEDGETNTSQINVGSEAMEEILKEILHGINDLKGGRKKGKGKKEIGEEASEIPRYIVNGSYGTKAVRMNSVLDHMITAFSKETYISQREIVEVAIVEFFLKYGKTGLIQEYLE